MKTFLIIFLAAILVAPGLLAKPQSLREKRLNAKTNYKIDKHVANTNAIDKTLFNEIKPEKTLKNDIRLEKTSRADKNGRDQELKVSGKAKQRRNSHFREWP